MRRRIFLVFIVMICIACAAAQTRRRSRPSTRSTQVQTSRGTAFKYSSFLHSSEKHKTLKCDDCHKIPTEWNARRPFPDVADFPNHDACVRCHRQQFFSGQAFAGTGPAICTVCHLRAAPKEAGRFAFGSPNNAQQPTKSKSEWQFTIEFPHDRHQNVIARNRGSSARVSVFLPVSFTPQQQERKPDYNNCSICHSTDRTAFSASPAGWADLFVPTVGTFKTMPHAHDACFNCHWKNEEPASRDCRGCHKPAAPFNAASLPKRISAKFNHEGGKGEHVMECTTCHINITRASSVRGLTPDVPIAACASCHKENKKTTYPKMTTIEEEFEQYKKMAMCTYCHTSDIGKKKPPPSHDAAAQ